jgi:uncharacterized protein YbjT (DUF2867 family)
MIVITAPTSQIGSKLVRDLLDGGTRLRLIVRDAGKLPAAVRDRVEIVEGSHGEAAIVDRAFEGAEAPFWLAPPDVTRTQEQAYLDFTRPAAEPFADMRSHASWRSLRWDAARPGRSAPGLSRRLSVWTIC